VARTRKPRKLSEAQQEALRKFAQPGGHGYGEFAHLSAPTANALAKQGFIELGTSKAGITYERMQKGILTEAGLEALNQLGGEFGRPYERSRTSIEHLPYGWISRAESKRAWEEFSRQQAPRRFRRLSYAWFQKRSKETQHARTR
jgi:hypothetical protein